MNSKCLYDVHNIYYGSEKAEIRSLYNIGNSIKTT